MTQDKPVRLINQKSARPTRKVQAQVLAGALVTILVFGLSRFGVLVPPDVIGAAVVAASFICSYYTKNEANQ